MKKLTIKIFIKYNRQYVNMQLKNIFYKKKKILLSYDNTSSKIVHF